MEQTRGTIHRMNTYRMYEVKEINALRKQLADTRALADAYYQEASTSLDHLKSEIRGSEAEFFENILDFVVKRDF